MPIPTTITRLKIELSDLLSIAHVEGTDTLENLGADSLDIVDICSLVEDEFSIEIAEFEITLKTTVAELAALIESRI